nr:uncharacterized protein LOC109159151 [Ipomoea trifida]
MRLLKPETRASRSPTEYPDCYATASHTCCNRGLAMSDSDSQNASARDYDDKVEDTPTDTSSANSARSPEANETEGGREGGGRGSQMRKITPSGGLLQPNPPLLSQPSTSTESDLVPLNSEDVRKHPCLLTVFELEEITSLLTRHVAFKTSRSLGNVIDQTHGAWTGIHLDSLKPPDYGRSEKYVPKKAAVTVAVPTPVSGPTNEDGFGKELCHHLRQA